MGKYPWSDKEAERREQRRPQPEKKQYVKIKQVSSKQAGGNTQYKLLRIIFLAEQPLCQCGLPGCTLKATQVHHKKGRGIWLLIVKYWLAVCANCHKWIEENPKEAKEKGFSVNRID